MLTYIKRILRFLKKLLIRILLIAIVVFLIYDSFLTINMEKIAHKENASFINPTFNNKLEVHMVDVGQGDGFIVTLKDKVLVIDTGTVLQSSAMKNYLEDMGVKTINALILTHPHQDHFGGLAKILCNFKVDKIYTTEIDNSVDMSLAERFHLYRCNHMLSKFNRINKYDKIETFKDSNNSFKEIEIDEIKIKFIGPLKSYSDINNNSLVFKLEYKDISMLFTGDIEKEAELDLVKEYGDKLKVDVLKISHHGSQTSSTEEFLNATSPKIALISCEYANSLWHPHKAVADRLEERGIALYRTDESGNIVLSSNGYSIESKQIKGDYKYGAQLKP